MYIPVLLGHSEDLSADWPAMMHTGLGLVRLGSWQSLDLNEASIAEDNIVHPEIEVYGNASSQMGRCCEASARSMSLPGLCLMTM